MCGMKVTTGIGYDIHISVPPTKPSQTCIRLKSSSLFTIHVRAVELLASIVTM